MCLCVAAVSGTVIPSLTGTIIDDISTVNNAAIKTHLGLLIIASLSQAVFTGLRGWAFSIAIARMKVRA